MRDAVPTSRRPRSRAANFHGRASSQGGPPMRRRAGPLPSVVWAWRANPWTPLRRRSRLALAVLSAAAFSGSRTSPSSLPTQHDDSLLLIANREFLKRAVQQFTHWQPCTSTFGSSGSRIVLISRPILTMRCVVAFATEIRRAEVGLEWALLTVKIANA
jgi:hypothetical protein